MNGVGAELAYVRSRLRPLKAPALHEASAATGVHVKTMRRIRSKQTKFGRTDTIGKLAMYFRTKEKRMNT
jgi:hypothetical protein